MYHSQDSGLDLLCHAFFYSLTNKNMISQLVTYGAEIKENANKKIYYDIDFEKKYYKQVDYLPNTRVPPFL